MDGLGGIVDISSKVLGDNLVGVDTGRGELLDMGDVEILDILLVLESRHGEESEWRESSGELMRRLDRRPKHDPYISVLEVSCMP